jgi:predicted Holliday junction resolvase-like endonuclease
MIFILGILLSATCVYLLFQRDEILSLRQKLNSHEELIMDLTKSQSSIISHIAREDRKALKLAKHFPNYNPN